MSRIRVGILFGGRSAEHEVSLQSARNIVDAIDKEKYEVLLIGIDKNGGWHLDEGSRFLLGSAESEIPQLSSGGENLALVPGKQRSRLFSLQASRRPARWMSCFRFCTDLSARMALSRDC